MAGYIGDIEKQTVENTNFRKVLFTGEHAQLVVMSLQPGEDIGDEVHPKVDQFFRIEQGEAKFIFNEKETHTVHTGEGVVLYTVYSPQNHPPGTVHATKADAKAAEHHEVVS